MRKLFKTLISLAVVATVVGAFFLTVNLIDPGHVVEDNPFILKEGQKTMLCAHRGGRNENPENTLRAFEYSASILHADINETDLYMTSDGVLVLSHDSSINRMSDVELVNGSDKAYYIGEHTYEELSQFNYGYGFSTTTETGETLYPYRYISTLNGEEKQAALRQEKVYLLTFREFISAFYNDYPDMLYIVEIKNAGEVGFKAADYIAEVLSEYPNYLHRVVIGTFHDEVETYIKENHPELYRGASTGAATSFIVTEMLGVNLFDQASFACLQIPTSQYMLDLTWDRYISRAHRRNIAVQYWTINDEETMRSLIAKGADAIMTDNPALLRSVLDSIE